MSSVALPHGASDPQPGQALAVVFLHERSEHSEADTGCLTIHTLGRFSVSAFDRRLMLEEWPRKQAIQLLKILAFQAGRPVHRDRLIDLLWPDADAETGWARLKVTVHFLRQKFREAGLTDEIIATDDAAYVLRLDRVRMDCLRFEELAHAGRKHQRAGRTAEAIAAFREAQNLYAGDYMEADLYADWCAEERERLLDIYIDVVNTLAELNFAAGDFASAAQDCHTALVREPCRESAHRLLIQSLIALHRPDRAIRQFERCQAVLAAELDVAPAPETAALIAPLLRPDGRPGTPAAASSPEG
jgi:DNA-binding SARP family transcriptional activator